MRRTHEDIQDELLVLQCQEGDGNALRELITRWQPRLKRLAWRLTGRREAAADVTQEAWMAIVRGLKSLDNPARFRIWAYRIVRNKCADWISRRAVRRKAVNDLQESAGSNSAGVVTSGEVNAAESADELAQLRRAISALPDEQRAVLALYYLDEMGVTDIATVLSIAPGTVKSRLHQARARLRHALERMKT